MPAKRKWPLPGQTSADGCYYTDRDGRVHEKVETALCTHCGLFGSDDCFDAPCTQTHGWSVKPVGRVRVPK